MIHAVELIQFILQLLTKF